MGISASVNIAWDAMLLKTGVELELLHDEELYNMVEKGLRGGMCQVSMRKSIANNKYMGDAYDETKPSSYINYLDANNLYGLAMCKKLPYKNVEFAHQRIDLSIYLPNGPIYLSLYLSNDRSI